MHSASGAIWALILAAGQGSRLAAALGGRPKQFAAYRGAPLYWQSALAMSRAGLPAGLVFVFPRDLLAQEEERLRELDRGGRLGLPWLCVGGGSRRQDSVRNGLAALGPDVGAVLVHDAARPFVSPALVRRICQELAAGAAAVVPGVAVNDTIKLLSEDGGVQETLPRERLVAVQTPQGFDLGALRLAHSRHAGDVTDDATLMELAGLPVRLVPGERLNVKITNPEDLALLERERRVPLTGMGYDVHRYGPGRPLRLGGVPIGGDTQVLAHSDGDVLLHALMDALLGLGSLGDIGSHFPDTDPRYEGASSPLLLAQVLDLLLPLDLEICHVDLTVAAQKPKLAPHAREIAANVAHLLGLAPSRVAFKATTEEGMGFTGRGEGLRAWALVTALGRASPH